MIAKKTKPFDLRLLLQRIERNLDKIMYCLGIPLQPYEQEKTWVKVGVIQELTGWDKERLREARNNGEIICEHRDDGIFYELESVDSKFLLIKKQQ